MKIHSEYRIQKQKNKAEIYKELKPLRWSPALGRWMCSDPDLITQLLNDKDFGVHDYRVEGLEKRFNINLSHTHKMLDHFPLAYEGEEHKLRRKKVAITLAQGSDIALANFQKDFEDKVQSLTDHTHFDLSSELLRPAISKILLEISGISISHKPAGIDSLSQVLDETLSLKKRIEINRTIGALLKLLPEEIPESEKYFKIATLALGSDGLIGTLTESVAQILLANEGKRCCDIDWDVEPPCTGVPVLERIAQTDKILAGEKILAGQRIRLYIDAAGYMGPEAPFYSQLYFGAGKHTCLGMPVSKKIWTIIKNGFKNLGKKLSVVEATYRSDDNVFNLYEKILVNIHD